MMKNKISGLFEKFSKMEISTKRVLIVTIISILALLILISTSLARFIQNEEGSQKEMLSSGKITIVFNDSEGNAVSIDPAKPVSDDYGSSLDPYTFTVTNNGTNRSTYEVKLVDSKNLSTDSINNLKPFLTT